LAKSYDFASCDNPSGSGEMWTPHLWTECDYGHEFSAYSGSWHAVAGIALFQRLQRVRDVAHQGQRFAPGIHFTLERYRGYSANGQFLDQRLRYRPVAYVLPGMTVHF